MFELDQQRPKVNWRLDNNNNNNNDAFTVKRPS